MQNGPKAMTMIWMRRWPMRRSARVAEALDRSLTRSDGAPCWISVWDRFVWRCSAPLLARSTAQISHRKCWTKHMPKVIYRSLSIGEPGPCQCGTGIAGIEAGRCRQPRAASPGDIGISGATHWVRGGLLVRSASMIRHSPTCAICQRWL